MRSCGPAALLPIEGKAADGAEEDASKAAPMASPGNKVFEFGMMVTSGNSTVSCSVVMVVKRRQSSIFGQINEIINSLNKVINHKRLILARYRTLARQT
jgi:hypothetical protein